MLSQKVDSKARYKEKSLKFHAGKFEDKKLKSQSQNKNFSQIKKEFSINLLKTEKNKDLINKLNEGKPTVLKCSECSSI